MDHFRLSSLVNPVCARFSVGLLLSLSLFQMSALAERVLVAQKSGDGKFTFISADEILINGSRRIKLASKSNGILDASALKSLPKVEISRAGVIKGDGKGALFAIAGGEQKRVLPENFTAKEVSDPGSLQVPIEITVVKDRKGKDSTVVPTQTFCIYIPGEAEPERAGEAFVLHVENFSSFDQQLSAIEGFVASFPGSPAVNELRVSLGRQLQTAIRAYDAGGTYQALSDARKLADLTVKEFPNDRALAEATKQIDQQREQTMGAYRHLQDLAGMEAWADFLAAYQNFELHADSFPEIQALHRRALEEKVHMDCRNGRALLLRKSENEAVRKFAEALEKDPANAEIQKQWEGARMQAAKSEAAQNQSSWTPAPKNSPEEHQHEIDESLQGGNYSRAYALSSSALKADPSNPALLYAAGISAAVLAKTTEAEALLKSYLKHSDNLAGDPSARRRVRQLMAVLNRPAIPEGSGTPNWFSGRRLPEGVYYCPVSLAFQIPIESVAGFKSHMTYLWDHGRLTAIHTEFEDEKGQGNYWSMVSRVRSKSLNETANFVFTYDPKGSPVRAVYAAEPGKDVSPFDATVRLLKGDDGSARLVDAKGNAQVVLPNDPLLDTEVVRHLLGNITTLVSGNSFFNPFIWDGVHYFTATYDSEGRVATAKEWNADNILHFSWENQRLLAISAFRQKESEPYYQRTISYTGTNISSEEYSSGGHTGRIKYQFAKNVLTSVKVEDGGVHDGKTWTARLQPRELAAR